MIDKYTLSNGIPVFIVETDSSPVVSVQAWVSRGSVYETPKLAGISHFLEHSLFKGTKKRKVGQIALEVESCGGEINAFTSFEETVYYATLASRYFENGLDIITDAIQNPTFDAEEMLREREVILEEIKRASDSPYKMLSQNLWRTAFPSSPYGRPVLGFESTVKTFDHRTLKSYFDRHYHTGSISFFIVGAVDSKKAFQACQKRLGRVRHGAKLKIPTVPSYFGARHPKVILTPKDVKECQIQIAWPTPPLADPRIPSFDLLCTALGHGESSPLFQHLVKEKKVALDVSMGLIATARCGMAAIGLQVAPEKLDEAVKEALQVLQDVAVRGIPDSHLERVKTSLESEVIAGKETVEGYARRLGYYYIQFGDPDFEKKYLESLLGVDAEEATGALREFLKQRPILSAVHPNDLKPEAAAFEKILNLEKPQALATRKMDGTLKLEKHGTARFVQKHITHLPIISLKILFPGGSREEAPEQRGLSTLLQRIWTSGTPNYTSRQIAHRLESLGASLHAISGRHNLGLSMECLTKHWPLVKPILSEVLLSPTFPDDEYKTEQEILLQEIRSERDTPGQLCQLNFMEALYGDHPYGRSSLGNRESVSRLTPGDLKAFYKTYVNQKQVVVSTVGAFDESEWEQELQELLRQLPSLGKDPSPARPIAPHEKLKITIAKKEPLFQSHILVGFLAAGFKDDDRFAMKILSSCLSGQGGRLFLELRDKQSLAYSVAPLNSDNPERGMFGVYIGCSTEKLETAVRGIREELDKIVQNPISQKELSRAKEFWIGRFELEMQRFSSQAMMLGLDEIYGLGYDHSLKISDRMKAVGADDVLKAAQKYIRFDEATFSIVHNREVGDELIRNAWNE